MPRIVDRFTAKGNLLIGFASYAIAHAIIFYASNTLLLILGAIFMGIGFGLTQALLNNMVVDRSTKYNKGKNLSLFSMATFLGQFFSSFVSMFFIGILAFKAACCLAIISFCLVLIIFKKHT